MLQADLSANLLRRVWMLRQFAMLDGAALDELATVAHNLVETELEPGVVVATAGARPTDVHFVLDGELGTTDGRWRWGHHELCGAGWVVAECPAPQTIVALTRTRTLSLAADDLDDILEDNFSVLMATLRSIARELLVHQRRLPTTRLPAQLPGGLVERLLAFRRQAPFAQAHPRPLAALAHAARDVTWDANQTIAAPGVAVEEAFIIMAGTLRVDGRALADGEAVGLLELLAARPHQGTYETITATRAIAITGAALFDILEDHGDLGLDMLRAMSRALVGTRAA